jgi:hypothetical protein
MSVGTAHSCPVVTADIVKINRKYFEAAVLMLCAVIASSQADQLKTANTGGLNRPTRFDNDDQLLACVQKQYFEYMWSGAEPSSGLARVRLLTATPERDKDVITVGGSGFGIAGMLVGIEHNFITREQAVERLEKVVNFLQRAKRHRGMWPHWIRAYTGETIPFAGSGGKDNGGDIVESAFMMESLLCVRQYLKDGNEREKVIASRINTMWQEMDWDWYCNGNDFLLWHWSPDYAWAKNVPLRGYNECLMAYLLGASSPTHSISKSVYYKGWGRGGEIVNGGSRYGIPLIVRHNTGENMVGPLFWASFSYVGFDPRGVKDEMGINYFKVNVNQAKIQHAYCVENPKGFTGYGDNCWGMTAGYSVSGYKAHNLKNDFGVISPAAALCAVPYTPRESMAALKHYYFDLGDQLWGEYGFYDGFSQTKNLYLKSYLANNQCAVAPMIENYRTGLLWKLFMSCPEVQQGLRKLGFTPDNN